MDAITLTFGDCMENHVGMQKVGELAPTGYSLEDLLRVQTHFQKVRPTARTELHELSASLEGAPPAYLLIVRGALSPQFTQSLLAEHQALEVDKEYYDRRRGRVLKKHARWNLCFDDEGQEPDYENKKGTIVAYDEVPRTHELRKIVGLLAPGDDLKLEANYYYDLEQTGIGYHGDSERRRVIGVRLGKDNPLVFRWYLKGKHVNTPLETVLSNGDLYMMSEKTVGTDWKVRNLPTLRHAAGCRKFTHPEEPPKKKQKQ
jgi:hypothetical protein